MTLLYVEPVDEESAWHMPICRVMNLPGSASDMSMCVVSISKVKHIFRGGNKEKQ